ncbi:two-component system heavy metal sensor histidine kinase CusS [Pelomonas saccharophila]|uniref:Sensor protein n=1 Tax=Roseateles saccharophilus TaxID=304 RepID=A0ABU1YFR6_ROSSA|nr:heavy metal sensor histidine kinase [Roseateles saccharophilus]MDR7267697.1 two-component system heavy metal sensor histidine kinase CusS [Roseateles saccharophilus]
MRLRWLPRSLAVRVTLLCALIAAWTTGMLGMFYFFSARTAILAHADEQLTARAEHFRRMVGDVRTVEELRDRAMLFEALLGSADDVLMLRRPGEAPLVEINPVRAAPPPGLVPGPVHDMQAPGQPRLHWVSALARSGPDGSAIEVVAGHPLVSEMQMIAMSRDKAITGTAMAMLASTLLVGWVLRHGLRPLHRVAAQAAQINPINLAIRLPEHDAPQELRDMVAVFNAMLDRISTGYERLSQFSADLAHEIRTPVGTLIGQTQVALNRSRSPAEYQQLLESNLEELNRLRLIVDNILFLAQADHATLDIQRAPLDMAEELRLIAEYFEGPADEAGLRFAVQAHGRALVNTALCRRAVHNLVVNALRYSTPGTTVRLIGSEDETRSTLAVENDGLPIPPEQLGRLFDRFYRADAARGRPAESSGLGLAIVKAIMALHGGEAGVSCTPQGTIRFELRFPRAGAELSPGRAAAAPPPGAASPVRHP